MASEITEDKEAEKLRIRQIIDYQKSIYHSSSHSSSFSSASASASASASVLTSSRKSSSLLDLMKEGSTSLGRLFDMEHISLGKYLMEYSVTPIVKPILLWGSESDNDEIHEDPWADVKGKFSVGQVSLMENFDDHEVVMQQGRKKKKRRRKLMRKKSYRILPRFSFWRCGVFRFRLKLFRRLRIMIRGKFL